MVIHKQKKNRRQRGHTSHGWGSMKKHRGAGNRGGRGLAGSGARGDQKKPSLWKTKRYFGKSGFKSKSRMPDMVPVNIKTLDDRAETLQKKGLLKVENDAYVVDLSKLGYNKLLSTGKATRKFMITVDYATPKAVEKIKKAGGDVNVLVKKQAPAAEKQEAESPKEEAPAEEASA
jgi:large subunit ribosomal protein L15